MQSYIGAIVGGFLDEYVYLLPKTRVSQSKVFR